MSKSDKEIQKSKDVIDDYLTTVYAIIGFLNTYKYELSKLDKELVVFQGRKLFLDQDEKEFVTPDLGLSILDGNSLVGEIKHSFPIDKNLWLETFTQIKKYENILKGWPTKTGTSADFDIVLIVQQSRSRAVIDYYLNTLTSEQKLNKTFAIVEFNRASQSKEYFHFRIEHGALSNTAINEKLMNGLYVPYDIFASKYSTVKIYDVKPPLPLLLQLIYDCVIDKLRGEGTFKKLTKKTKQTAVITSQEITQTLRDAYSFKNFHPHENLKGEAENPKHEWIKDAFDKLAELGEGNWLDKGKGQFAYILNQKEEDILQHYIKNTIGLNALQQELF